jgi:hypothetical protein
MNMELNDLSWVAVGFLMGLVAGLVFSVRELNEIRKTKKHIDAVAENIKKMFEEENNKTK